MMSCLHWSKGCKTGLTICEIGLYVLNIPETLHALFSVVYCAINNMSGATFCSRLVGYGRTGIQSQFLVHLCCVFIIYGLNQYALPMGCSTFIAVKLLTLVVSWSEDELCMPTFWEIFRCYQVWTSRKLHQLSLNNHDWSETLLRLLNLFHRFTTFPAIPQHSLVAEIRLFNVCLWDYDFFVVKILLYYAVKLTNFFSFYICQYFTQ